jgi:uncharacterized protein (TIGR00251 family)
MTAPLAVLRARLAAERRLALAVRVVPKSPRTEWVAPLADGSLKVRLAAVPEKGKANEELIRFLAAEFSIPRSNVEIVSGAASAHKQLRLSL